MITTGRADEPATEPFPDEIVAAVAAENEARRCCQGRPGLEPELEDLPSDLGDPEGGSEDFRPPWTSLVHEPAVTPFVPRFRPDVAQAPPDFRVLLLDPPEPVAAKILPPCGFPWSTVGRVEYGHGERFDQPLGHGTGTLVGPNLLLTASHLMPWNHPPEGWWMRFAPGYVSGLEPYGHSYVERVHGYRTDGHPGGLDCVVGKLYEPLGERVGWMGSQSFGDEDRYTDPLWLSVGYPDVYLQGLVAALDTNIGIEDIDDDDNGSLELEVDYGVTFGGGWSGGPLFGPIGGVGGPFKVIGVKSGYEADGWDPVRGVFAGGRPMVGLVKYGLANW